MYLCMISVINAWVSGLVSCSYTKKLGSTENKALCVCVCVCVVNKQVVVTHTTKNITNTHHHHYHTSIQSTKNPTPSTSCMKRKGYAKIPRKSEVTMHR